MKDSYTISGEEHEDEEAPPPPPSSRRSSEGFVNVAFNEEVVVSDGRRTSLTGGALEMNVQPPPQFNAKPKKVTQILGTFAAAMAQLGIGTIIGFSGATLPRLISKEEPSFHLTETQTTLFSSIIHLGATLGCIAGGVPHAIIGHRWSLLMSLPGSLMAWLILYFSQTPWLLIFARGILGFTMGVTCFSASNYVKEFADVDIRPTLMAALDTLRQSGFLFVYALGHNADLTWRHIAIICGTVTTVVPFAILIFLPNSPRWLAMRGRLDAAQRSLEFYRGSDYDCHGELTKIRAKLTRRRDSLTMTDQLRNMRDPVIFRFVVLFAFLHFVSQFTGEVVISTYIVPIFEVAHATSPSADSVIAGSVRVLATLVYFLEVQRVGRKRLVISSFSICGVALGILAIFFFDQTRNRIFSDNELVPIIAISIFVFFSNIGFPVLNLVDIELLPVTARATGIAILYGSYYFGGFIATLTYPTMVDSIGLSATFWIYCAFNIIVVIIDYADLPETRGKTSEEIIDKEREEEVSKKASIVSLS